MNKKIENKIKKKEIIFFEKRAENVKNKYDVLKILDLYINFVEEIFFNIQKIHNKSDDFIEVVDRQFYLFHDKLDSVDSPMSYFLFMKKIKDFNLSKIETDSIRDIFRELISLSMNTPAYARVETLWNKSEEKSIQKNIDKLSLELKKLLRK